MCLKNDYIIGNMNKRSGFTLIELLIATAVISIVMVAATSLLMIFFRTQRIVKDKLYMHANARYITSLIAEHMYEGMIDYDAYSQYMYDPQHMLVIRNRAGSQTIFWFDSTDHNMYLCKNNPPSQECANWSQLNPSDMKFTVGAFSVYPLESPYSSGIDVPLTNDSPFVTTMMQLKMNDGANETPLIQTGFTSRYYVR